MNKERNEKLIELVAKEISDLIPDCCGVTLGGSRCYGLEDEHSDVEMYFYTHQGAPSLESITTCLVKLNAEHKRTESFLWKNKMPWGPHSFFVIEGLYFEIGYRNIDDIKQRIIDYESGIVFPQNDCHDLGLGYMPSGLAASVSAEKILIKGTYELEDLKKIAEKFSQSLLINLKTEYFDTAQSLIDGKLLVAVEREDIFLYESIAGRIMRCLIVMAFALDEKHFPGDKWNEYLLKRLKWKNKNQFIKLMKEHIIFPALNKNDFIRKRNILKKAFNLIKIDLEELING